QLELAPAAAVARAPQVDAGDAGGALLGDLVVERDALAVEETALGVQRRAGAGVVLAVAGVELRVAPAAGVAQADLRGSLGDVAGQVADADPHLQRGGCARRPVVLARARQAEQRLPAAHADGAVLQLDGVGLGGVEVVVAHVPGDADLVAARGQRL